MIDYSNHRITASSDPFPHLVIDGWYSNPDERRDEYFREYEFNTTSSYLHESASIMNLIRNNMPGLDSGSKHWRDDFAVEITHNFWLNENHEILRDTHTDGNSKYFQVLAYLYPAGVDSLPDDGDGALELMQASGSTGLLYNGDNDTSSINWEDTEWEVAKTIPYVNNRAVILQVDSGSAHRMWSVRDNVKRQTIVTSFVNYSHLCH